MNMWKFQNVNLANICCNPWLRDVESHKFCWLIEVDNTHSHNMVEWVEYLFISV